MRNPAPEATTGCMDQDILFSAARSLDLLAREPASDKMSEIRERALLRRARQQYAMVAKDPDPKDPMAFRTVWRTGQEPRLVHWLVGGIAEAGKCAVFEDRDFVACGNEIAGIAVQEDKRWSRSTIERDALTCPKCLKLFRAASR